MSPTFYRGCWHVVSRDLFLCYRPCSSHRKGFYDPKTFFTHAASLHQACAHCAIFLTAASRRSLGRVSVPVWGVTLSGPLPVVAMVSFYLTISLMGRSLVPKQQAFSLSPLKAVSLCGISALFRVLSRTWGPISYVFLTRAPLTRRCVRLACVRHAANVHPEPGSNSPFVFDRVFCCLFRLLFLQVWLPACFHLTILLLSCVPLFARST